jgi:hypothetical protein
MKTKTRIEILKHVLNDKNSRIKNKIIIRLKSKKEKRKKEKKNEN